MGNSKKAMIQAAQNEIDLWLRGVPDEIVYWDSFFSVKRNREKTCLSVGEELLLPAFSVKEFYDEHKNGFTVLDIGCSASFIHGNQIGGQPVDMHYVDPLAVFYNRIIEKYSINLPEIEFGMVEYISSFYEQQSISLIIIANALDHCFNPVKGIQECVKLLKKGGVLYLKHHRNVAEMEYYHGFHQYNIDIIENELVIWRDNDYKKVIDCLGGTCQIGCQTDAKGDVIAVIEKKSDAMLVEDAEAPPDQLRLCAQLIHTIERMNDKKYMAGINRKLWWAKPKQFLLRRMSDSSIATLRKFFHKIGVIKTTK